MQKRIFHIDFVRAIAILVIIATHVFSYNLTSPITRFLWNYSHFTVGAFVFCSGYALFVNYYNKIHSWQDILLFYRRRLFRLLVPFYIYLFIHYILQLVFPHFFSGLGLEWSWIFFLKSVFLIGGINLNWLPLLFLQLAIVFPITLLAFTSHKKLFWIGFAVTTAISIAMSVWTVPYQYYRQTMWVGWLVVFLLAFLISRKEQIKQLTSIKYLFLGVLSFVLWIVLFSLWHNAARPMNLIDNKYPPNWYDLSFELSGTFLLASLGALSIYPPLAKKFFLFVSTVSYQLFFIHYIVLDLLLSLSKTYTFLRIPFVLLFLTVCGSLSISYAFRLIRYQRR